MRDGEGRVITFACKFATHTHPFDTQFTLIYKLAATAAVRYTLFFQPRWHWHQ